MKKKLYQRICPHTFGWSYNTHRRRRWCRACATQQRTPDEGKTWKDVGEGGF